MMGRETRTLDPSDPADLDEMRSNAEGEEFFRSLQSPGQQRAGLELLASHVRALVAAVARLTAERDAVIGAFIRGPTIIGQTYFIVGTDLGLDGARFRDRAAAVAAVRRAAGLEEKAPR